MTNQKNVSKSNAITKKQSWFATHSAQNIIGVISILGVVSIVSICYESFRIPSLTTKIESLNIQIKKKEKDISEMTGYFWAPIREESPGSMAMILQRRILRISANLI